MYIASGFGMRLERFLGGKAPLELIVERDWYGNYGNVLYALHSWQRSSSMYIRVRVNM
jgi:hypothetical protein